MPKKIISKAQNKSKSVKKTEYEPKLNIPVALQFKQTLINNGYRGLQLEFLLTQAAHESDGFYKDKALENFNYGGVKWNKNMIGLEPSSDFSAPSKEAHGKRTPYVRFKSMDDFVKKWVKVAHISGMRADNHIGPPIEATTLEEYDHRLALNGYHQETNAVYVAALKRWDPVVKKDLLEDNSLLPNAPVIKSSNTRPENNTLKMQGSTQPDMTRYMRTMEFADHTRIADPAEVAAIKRQKLANKKDSAVNDLYKINALLDLPGWLKTGMKIAGQPDIPLSTGIKMNSTNALDSTQLKTNVKTPSSQNALNSMQPAIDKDQIMKNIFMRHPEIKSKWSVPELNNNQDIKDNPGDIAGASSDLSRTVNINLNTPMIGNFTISAKDTGAGLNDLKHQVEEVLLEILNSANAIQ